VAERPKIASLKFSVPMLGQQVGGLPPALKWTDTRRASRHQRGYGSAWDKLRLTILKRDGYLCQCNECKQAKRIRQADEVDHIVNKAEGGTDDPSNLQAINTDCHKRKTRAEAARAHQ
jgi:5-methylcytosine-specific restriction enzyme A